MLRPTRLGAGCAPEAGVLPGQPRRVSSREPACLVRLLRTVLWGREGPSVPERREARRLCCTGPRPLLSLPAQ